MDTQQIDLSIFKHTFFQIDSIFRSVLFGFKKQVLLRKTKEKYKKYGPNGIKLNSSKCWNKQLIGDLQ